MEVTERLINFSEEMSSSGDLNSAVTSNGERETLELQKLDAMTRIHGQIRRFLKLYFSGKLTARED